VLITPLNNRIQGWAERRFQKALMRLRRDLPECVADMRETSGLEALLEEVVDRVAGGVRASRMAVTIGDRAIAARGVTADELEGWRSAASLDATVEDLDCDPGDPLLPMRVPLRVRHGSGEPVGWMLLGPRPDGSFYGKDEREALSEVADPIARAVSIVLAREARESETAGWRQEIESRIAALAAAVEAASAAVPQSLARRPG
jgi:hypothetical protein